MAAPELSSRDGAPSSASSNPKPRVLQLLGSYYDISADTTSSLDSFTKLSDEDNVTIVGSKPPPAPLPPDSTSSGVFSRSWLKFPKKTSSRDEKQTPPSKPPPFIPSPGQTHFSGSRQPVLPDGSYVGAGTPPGEKTSPTTLTPAPPHAAQPSPPTPLIGSQPHHSQPNQPPYPPEGNQPPPNYPLSPSTLNSPSFSVNDHFSHLLKTASLKDLLQYDTQLINQTRSIDADMCTLVYENYPKFISASDMINDLKEGLVKMDEDVKVLSLNMETIDSFSSRLSASTSTRADKIEELVAVRQLLMKMEVVFKIPVVMRDLMSLGRYDEIVKSFSHCYSFFENNQDNSRLFAIYKIFSRLYVEAIEHLKKEFFILGRDLQSNDLSVAKGFLSLPHTFQANNNTSTPHPPHAPHTDNTTPSPHSPATRTKPFSSEEKDFEWFKAKITRNILLSEILLDSGVDREEVFNAWMLSFDEVVRAHLEGWVFAKQHTAEEPLSHRKPPFSSSSRHEKHQNLPFYEAETENSPLKHGTTSKEEEVSAEKVTVSPEIAEDGVVSSSWNKTVSLSPEKAENLRTLVGKKVRGVDGVKGVEGVRGAMVYASTHAASLAGEDVQPLSPKNRHAHTRAAVEASPSSVKIHSHLNAEKRGGESEVKRPSGYTEVCEYISSHVTVIIRQAFESSAATFNQERGERASACLSSTRTKREDPEKCGFMRLQGDDRNETEAVKKPLFMQESTPFRPPYVCALAVLTESQGSSISRSEPHTHSKAGEAGAVSSPSGSVFISSNETAQITSSEGLSYYPPRGVTGAEQAAIEECLTGNDDSPRGPPQTEHRRASSSLHSQPLSSLHVDPPKLANPPHIAPPPPPLSFSDSLGAVLEGLCGFLSNGIYTLVSSNFLDVRTHINGVSILAVGLASLKPFLTVEQVNRLNHRLKNDIGQLLTHLTFRECYRKTQRCIRDCVLGVCVSSSSFPPDRGEAMGFAGKQRDEEENPYLPCSSLVDVSFSGSSGGAYTQEGGKGADGVDTHEDADRTSGISQTHKDNKSSPSSYRPSSHPPSAAHTANPSVSTANRETEFFLDPSHTHTRRLAIDDLMDRAASCERGIIIASCIALKECENIMSCLIGNDVALFESYKTTMIRLSSYIFKHFLLISKCLPVDDIFKGVKPPVKMKKSEEFHTHTPAKGEGEQDWSPLRSSLNAFDEEFARKSSPSEDLVLSSLRGEAEDLGGKEGGKLREGGRTHSHTSPPRDLTLEEDTTTKMMIIEGVLSCMRSVRSSILPPLSQLALLKICRFFELRGVSKVFGVLQETLDSVAFLGVGEEDVSGTWKTEAAMHDAAGIHSESYGVRAGMLTTGGFSSNQGLQGSDTRSTEGTHIGEEKKAFPDLEEDLSNEPATHTDQAGSSSASWSTPSLAPAATLSSASTRSANTRLKTPTTSRDHLSPGGSYSEGLSTHPPLQNKLEISLPDLSDDQTHTAARTPYSSSLESQKAAFPANKLKPIPPSMSFTRSKIISQMKMVAQHLLDSFILQRATDIANEFRLSMKAARRLEEAIHTQYSTHTTEPTDVSEYVDQLVLKIYEVEDFVAAVLNDPRKPHHQGGGLNPPHSTSLHPRSTILGGDSAIGNSSMASDTQTPLTSSSLPYSSAANAARGFGSASTPQFHHHPPKSSGILGGGGGNHLHNRKTLLNHNFFYENPLSFLGSLGGGGVPPPGEEGGRLSSSGSGGSVLSTQKHSLAPTNGGVGRGFGMRSAHMQMERILARKVVCYHPIQFDRSSAVFSLILILAKSLIEFVREDTLKGVNIQQLQVDTAWLSISWKELIEYEDYGLTDDLLDEIVWSGIERFGGVVGDGDGGEGGGESIFINPSTIDRICDMKLERMRRLVGRE